MESSDNRLVSAKEISSRFHIPYSTINHYTNLGFLSVVKRRGNARFYREKEVRVRLDKISRWKDEGYPLRLISKMLKDQE